jgi:hypothetical protein
VLVAEAEASEELIPGPSFIKCMFFQEHIKLYLLRLKLIWRHAAYTHSDNANR